MDPPEKKDTFSLPAVTLKFSWSSTVLVLVIAALFGIFVIRPTYIGYTVYQEMQRSNYSLEQLGQNVQVLTSDLEKTQVNLSTYADLNDDLLDEIQKVSDNRSQCEAALERLSASVEFYDDQLEDKEDLLKEQKNKADLELVNALGNLRAELETKHQLSLQKLQSDHAACLQNISNSQGQAAAVQQRFDAFVKTIARSVCCKERVDNSNIRFYKVVDDRLLCLEDAGEPLFC